MQLSKTKMYPYPVLWEENEDYINGEFKVEYYGYKKHGDKVKFIFDVQITDKTVLELVKENKANIILHIENSKTKYRKKFDIHCGNNEIVVKSSELNGKIEFATLIVLVEDIVYTNSNLAEYFKGIKFNLPMGTIIGIGSHYEDVIEKETSDLSKLNSIISVIKHENSSSKGFDVTCDKKEKVYIKLPEKAYLNYSKISSRDDCKNIIFSMLIIPAIEYALNYMKENIKEESDIDEFADYRWFKVLTNKIKDLYDIKEFNLDFIGNMNVLEVAQKIMDYPVDNALNELNGGE